MTLQLHFPRHWMPPPIRTAWICIPLNKGLRHPKSYISHLLYQGGNDAPFKRLHVQEQQGCKWWRWGWWCEGEVNKFCFIVTIYIVFWKMNFRIWLKWQWRKWIKTKMEEFPSQISLRQFKENHWWWRLLETVCQPVKLVKHLYQEFWIRKVPVTCYFKNNKAYTFSLVSERRVIGHFCNIQSDKSQFFF